MPDALILNATTAADLQAIGERLGRALAVGDVLASPTFALVNEHPGRVPLVHADLYRINDPRELEELGLADAFDRAAVAIEWLDRFPDAAPAERLTIEIAIAADETRAVTFRATGSRAETLVGALGRA